jgi:AraC family transcriptional regulator
MEQLDIGSPRVCTELRITPPDIFRHQNTNWDGIQVDTVQLLRREPFQSEFKGTSHLLIMVEHAERDDGETVIEGLPRSSRREFHRQLIFVPAGVRFFGWQKPRTLEITYFYIDPRSPLLNPEPRFAETDFKPRLFFFDRDLWDTLQRLKAEAMNPAGASRQYVEALSIVLAHDLLRLNDGDPAAAQRSRGGLAAWQQKKVTRYIEEHVAEDISLSELAQLANLSSYHFSRAFKESVGVPPHRYLASRRIEKAKNLLADHELSVTKIGLALGYSETSSFTTSFRKHAGITPTAYRRGLE